jgi:hypothetical protein
VEVGWDCYSGKSLRFHLRRCRGRGRGGRPSLWLVGAVVVVCDCMDLVDDGDGVKVYDEAVRPAYLR